MKAIKNVRASKKNKNLRLKKREDRAIQEILQIEALETRMLLSGVGTGIGKKKVVFFDAVGDKVTVSVAESGKLAKSVLAPTFDITLDAGSDHSNIQSIIVHGDAGTSLSVLVTPQKFNVASGGGGTDYKYPVAYTQGFTEIGSILNTDNGVKVKGQALPNYGTGAGLRGIGANAAFIDNVNITGNLGGLAEDIGVSKFNGLTVSQIGQIHFGNVNVSGNLNALTLNGVSNAAYSNDLAGSITVGGTLGIMNAKFSNVLAPILAHDIGSLTVQDIKANVTATTSIGSVVATDLYSQIAAATIGSVSLVSTPAASGSANGNFAGSLVGTVTATTSLGPLSVAGAFTGTVSVTNGNLRGNISLNGTSFTGNILASGSIENVAIAQTGATAFGGHLIAGTSIGNVTAGNFSSADIEAGTSIGVITSLNDASLATGIVNTTITAHSGGIAGVNSAGSITGSTFSATGAIGAVNVSQGAINNDTFAGSSVGSISSVGAITNSFFTATTGGIGMVTTTHGAIGGTNVGNTFTGASLGGFSATGGDISYNSIQSTSGGIGSLTAVTGNITNDVIKSATIVGDLTSSLGSVSANTITGASVGNVSAAFNINANFIAASTGSIGHLTASAGTVGSQNFGNNITAGTSIGNITGATGIGYNVLNAGTTVGNLTSSIGSVSNDTITGAQVGNLWAEVNINSNFITATGSVGNLTANSGSIGGSSAGNTVAAGSIGNIAGATGISYDAFTATGAIGSLTTTHGAIGNDTVIGGSIGNLSANGGDVSNNLLQANTVGGTGIGNVGTLSGSVNSNKILSAAAIGNVSAATDIYSNIINATGAIGDVISTAGGVGNASAPNTGYPYYYAAPGNIISGASVGNVTARLNISGNIITATAGDVKNIMSTDGRIAGDTVTASGSIGNISAAPGGLSYAYDYSGNSFGNTANAIEGSNFVAGNNIGYIKAVSPDLDTGATDAITTTAFTATAGTIGAITATANGTRSSDVAINGITFRAGAGIGAVTANTFNTGAAIYDSTFDVTGGLNSHDTNVIGAISATSIGGAGITGTTVEAVSGSITSVSGTSNTGRGITDTTIHAISGNIGAVNGTSDTQAGIANTRIAADASNIGVVTGVSHGGAGVYGTKSGLYNVTIAAGPGLAGIGGIAGIVGTAAHGDGINGGLFTAGSGGIGYINGTSTDTHFGTGWNGLNDVTAFTTGTIGAIFGTAAGGNGIDHSRFSADGTATLTGGTVKGIVSITGTTTSQNSSASGISSSIFRTGADIGTVTATTSIAGATGIYGDASKGTSGTATIGGTDDSKSVSIPTVVYNNDGNSTIFSAKGNIGNITSTGDISGVVVVAGYDIGSDLSFDGIQSGHDYAQLPGTMNTVGNIQVNNGNLLNSAITAGVVVAKSAGVITFGDSTNMDNVVDGGYSNSSVGKITVTGFINNVIAAADTLDTSSVQATTGINGLYMHAYRGNIGDITASSNIAGVSTLVNSVFQADGDSTGLKGKIGNITVNQTAGGGGDAIQNTAFYAGYTGGKTPATGTSIGNITALTNGGSGAVNANAIDQALFLAKNGIGNISATVDNSSGALAFNGITSSLFDANVDSNTTGAIGTVTVNTNGAGSIGVVGGLAGDAGANAIDNTGFYAAAGIGAVSGVVNSETGGTGLLNVTLAGNQDIGTTAYGTGASVKAVTGLGTVGSVTGTTTGLGSGQETVFIHGQSIGDIQGLATNPNATTRQFGLSHVTAIAVGASSITGGATTSTIGAIDGEVYGIGVSGQWNAGINRSTFDAGLTIGETGGITTIKGIASNATAVGNQVGIRDTSFSVATDLAGGGSNASGVGTIGNVTASATATGATGAVTATAVYDSQFTVGGSISKVASSIGTITASAESNGIGGTITARGLAGGANFRVGLTGTIDTVLVTTKATANDGSLASATGLDGNTVIDAGNGDLSIGKITSFTSNAIASSTLGAATAYGVNGAAEIWAATGGATNSQGKIGFVTASGVANGATTVNAAGFINEPQIYAGSSTSAGTGTIGLVTGTAQAGVNAVAPGNVSATATGIQADVEANGAIKCSIDDVLGTAVATANTAYTSANATATATGIGAGTLLYSGLNGVGTIGVTKGTIIGTGDASAKTNGVYGGLATADGAGIDGATTSFQAGQTNGTVAANGITGTFKGLAQGAAATSTGYGIDGVDIQAANTPTGVNGLVGLLTGTANVTANATGAGAGNTAYAKGYGIRDTAIAAGNGTDPSSIGHLGNNADALIGTVWAIASATGADSTDSATAIARGIGGTTTVSVGLNGTGMVDNITGTIPTLTATANAGDASVNGRGIRNMTVDVGDTSGTGTIGAILGTVGSHTNTATALTTSGAASSEVYGVYNSTFSAGFVKGNIATVTGNAYAVANGKTNGYADAEGVYDNTIEAAAGGINGTLDKISGTAEASANSTTKALGGDTDVYAYGVDGNTFYAGTQGGAAVTTGHIGTITGIATAIGIAVGDSVDAYAEAVPGNTVAASSGSGAGSLGTIAAITGTANANADSTISYAEAYGVSYLTLSAGVNGGTGTIDLIKGDATAGAHSTGNSVGLTEADGYGLNHLTINAGNGIGAGSNGHVGNGADALQGTASVTAIADGNVASDNALAYGRGISTVYTMNVGLNGSGIVDNITGAVPVLTAKANAGDAAVNGRGIRNLNIDVADNAGNFAGTIGTIKGTVGAALTPASAISSTGSSTGSNPGDNEVDGIKDSFFSAGGTTSTGLSAIGNITGEAYLSLGAVTGAQGAAYGINGTTFNADSAGLNGQVGTIGGTAGSTVATSGSGGTGSLAFGFGISDLIVNAGTGAAVGSNGKVDQITGTANVIATATGTKSTDVALAAGFGVGGFPGNYTTITAGSNGKGTIIGITGAMPILQASTQGTGALAGTGGIGLVGVTLNAGNSDVNAIGIIGDIIGTVGSLTSTPTSAQATATAAAGPAGSIVGGIDTLNVQAGAINGDGAGTIGNIKGQSWTTATAAGAGNNVLVLGGGISNILGSSTINAVSGTGKGVGIIGDITATAIATGNASTAVGGGQANVQVGAIYNNGAGLTFTAGGTAVGGQGTIAKNNGISAEASATASGYTNVVANSRGIRDTLFAADDGGYNGQIGDSTTATGAIKSNTTAKATSTTIIAGGTTYATAESINGSSFLAGTKGGVVNSVGDIGNISTTANASANMGADDGNSTPTSAYGLNGVTITAGGGTDTLSSGIIGDISGDATASAIGTTTPVGTAGSVTAIATGIHNMTANAVGFTSTVGALTGHGKATAQTDGTGATATAIGTGIDPSYVNALGTTKIIKSLGNTILDPSTIGGSTGTISGIGEAYATTAATLGGLATANGSGISDTKFLANGVVSTIGLNGITGKFTGIANGACRINQKAP